MLGQLLLGFIFLIVVFFLYVGRRALDRNAGWMLPASPATNTPRAD